MTSFDSKHFDSVLQKWLLQKVKPEERAQLLSRLLCDPVFREQLSDFVRLIRTPWSADSEKFNSHLKITKRAA
jgi:hypothetical protein